MPTPFVQFGLIILVVFAVSIIMRLLRQPLIIGYIISGILVGPLFFNLIKSMHTITFFAEMGIAFLLFIVGLNLSPKVIKEVGKVSLITGIGQILFTSLVGYGIALLLGFSYVSSLYIAVALTFSSTIIIMKLLSDKDALDKLYGKISIGFLLVQDLVVILILIFVSSLSEGTGESILFFTILKGIVLLGIISLIAYYILPRFSDFFARSQEFLFVFALSWALGLSLLFFWVGFSIEIGALLAGITLSMFPYSHEISSKLKSLRDFFIIFFFIVLGSQMIFGNISELIIPAIIFSLFVLIGNPLIVMILIGALGYDKKTGFMSGLTVAQISEFSLILIVLGVKIGNIPQEILSFVTIIALLTITGSTYLIIYSDVIFRRISRFLYVFEKKRVKQVRIPQKIYNYLLLGYNRIGFSIRKAFSQLPGNFLVVDNNPEVIKNLKLHGHNALYGDANDCEFLEDLNLRHFSIIVVTIPEKETNELILEVAKRQKSNSVIILTARQIGDALDLYKEGADYVILPYFLGGEYTAKLIKSVKDNKEKYTQERRRELRILNKRLEKGHEHPKTERG